MRTINRNRPKELVGHPRSPRRVLVFLGLSPREMKYGLAMKFTYVGIPEPLVGGANSNLFERFTVFQTSGSAGGH